MTVPSARITSGKIMEAVTGQLKQIGVTMELRPAEFGVYAQAESSGNYDMVPILIGDPENQNKPWYNFFHSKGTTNPFIRNPELDKLIEDFEIAYGRRAQGAARSPVQELIYKEMYAAPTIDLPNWNVWQPWMMDYSMNWGGNAYVYNPRVGLVRQVQGNAQPFDLIHRIRVGRRPADPISPRYMSDWSEDLAICASSMPTRTLTKQKTHGSSSFRGAGIQADGRVSAESGSQSPQTRYWMIDGHRQPRMNRDDSTTKTTVQTRELMDVDARLRDMDAMGVETQIMFPTLFHGGITENPDIDKALRRSYNRWLSDRRIARRGGWLGLPTAIRRHRRSSKGSQASQGARRGGRAQEGRSQEAGKWPNDEYFYPVYEESSTSRHADLLPRGIGRARFHSLA